ncbi:MAG: polysaccharide biosynthesis tyrosine autokinase [Candidatus Marinimicrobia bacterium]|nr:polysaccharide biosynthesis tyrosine autokinase [Candidatus Neomarinimicrobiota bacterium]
MTELQQYNHSSNHQYGFEESELSLKDIYYVLRRNSKVIFWVGFIVLFVTALKTLWMVPVYESTAMIMVDEPDQAMTVFDIGFGEDVNLLNNEIEILKSRSLAEAVVMNFWNSDQRNALFLFGTKTYQPEGIRKTVRAVLTFGLWDSDNVDLPYHEGEISDSLFNAFVKAVRGNMTVSNQRSTNILNVMYTSSDPVEAALVSNTIVKLYQERDLSLNTGELINLRNFLEDQLVKTGSNLAVLEDSLKSFQEREQIYGLEGNADLLLKQLTDIESKYFTTLAEVNIVKERIRYVSNLLSREEKELKDRLLNSINHRLFALRTEIAQNEADLIRNASIYGENHEAVKTVRIKIGKLKENLKYQTEELIAQGISLADPIKYRQSLIDTALIFEAQEAGLISRAGEYKKVVDLYNNQLSLLPAKSLQYARLERDRSVLAQTYLLMRQKLEEAKISQASQLGKVRIIDPAIPPEHRTKPKTKLNLLLGLILGTGLGVGGAFLLEYLDNTVKSVEDIERRGLTILGIIPEIGEQKRYGKKRGRKKSGAGNQGSKNGGGKEVSGKIQRRLITHEDPKSPISEAYRSLRTSLMYSSADKEVKSILISSPGPGEGKTTTVTNLAITYANLGKKTLLLDTDLRRPVLHRAFKLKRDPGITNYLSGETKDFNSLVHETEVGNLFVVTSGIVPPNPAELLGSNRMVKLVAKLEKEWDIVLLDSPPLVAVTDAAMISKEIDQLVMVVKSGFTDKGAFNRTLLAMENIDVPLAGVVLNAVTSKNSYGSYYYYYQYYHYYGDS